VTRPLPADAPPSDITLVIAVLLLLVLVIVATGYSLYREEQDFYYEREHRKRMRRELNRKLRNNEIEEDYE